MSQHEIMVQVSNPYFLQQRAAEADFSWFRVWQPAVLSARLQLSVVYREPSREAYSPVFRRGVSWFRFRYGEHPL
jgi:hypothetical protein